MKVFSDYTDFTVIMGCECIMMDMCCSQIGREKIEKEEKTYSILFCVSHRLLLFFESIEPLANSNITNSLVYPHSNF